MINFGVQNFPQQLDMSKKDNVILSNRLHKPLYNIDKIIIAFAQLLANPKYSHYILIIAATGSNTNKLTQLVDDLKINSQVNFIGMVDYTTLQKYYLQAKLFVSIPDSDSASLSALEAMSFGCYPILSNLPANLEYIIDEINGTICQNSNNLTGDMAKALELIDNHNEYTKIANFNYALVSQKAVFNNNIKKFIELY